MNDKFARVIGVFGGALAMLPYIAAVVIYALQFGTVDPQSPYAHQMVSDLVRGIVVYCAVPLVAACAGLAGGLLAGKKRILAGSLMIVAAGLWLAFDGLYPVAFASGVLTELTSNIWLMRMPALLLICAGTLALLSGKTRVGQKRIANHFPSETAS